MNSRIKLSLLMVLLVFGVFSLTNPSTEVLVSFGDNVTVEYTGWIGDHVFSTKNVSFIVGSKEVIPGLDAGVIGMRSGEVKNLTIPPSLAFGDYNDSLVFKVPLAFFAENNAPVPELGQLATLNGLTGQVTLITNDSIRFDANHELAGEELNMTVRLLDLFKG